MDKATLVRVLAALADDEFDDVVSDARREDNSVSLGQERAAAALRDYLKGNG